jgi:hypothetical protein
MLKQIMDLYYKLIKIREQINIDIEHIFLGDVKIEILAFLYNFYISLKGDNFKLNLGMPQRSLSP